MSELKRLNEDHLIREIKSAADEAYRKIDQRAIELIQEVRQAVVALPLELEAPVEAMYVKDIKVGNSIQLSSCVLDFGGSLEDLQSGAWTSRLWMTDNNRVNLRPGKYRVMLTITKLEEPKKTKGEG